MPRERWDALVRGEGCPLCAEVASDAPENEEGYVVADLPMSRLRLSVHQSVAGYCILICKRHVREPYELSREEQQAFFADLVGVGRVLEAVFGAAKMNFEILGNSVPHLHCHIKPRYYGDPAPGIPIWPDQYPTSLSRAAFAERVQLIRAALASDTTADPTVAGPDQE